MEPFVAATIIFIALFWVRMIIGCCTSYYSRHGCSKMRTVATETVFPETTPANIFVINIEDGHCDELPSYEHLEEQPPAYEDAVKLPPIV